jgi:hypothetical protein
MIADRRLSDGFKFRCPRLCGAYEHRKPAFVDDLTGLLIGPPFLLAEALFAFR